MTLHQLVRTRALIGGGGLTEGGGGGGPGGQRFGGLRGSLGGSRGLMTTSTLVKNTELNFH